MQAGSTSEKITNEKNFVIPFAWGGEKKAPNPSEGMKRALLRALCRRFRAIGFGLPVETNLEHFKQNYFLNLFLPEGG